MQHITTHSTGIQWNAQHNQMTSPPGAHKQCKRQQLDSSFKAGPVFYELVLASMAQDSQHQQILDFVTQSRMQLGDETLSSLPCLTYEIQAAGQMKDWGRAVQTMKAPAVQGVNSASPAGTAFYNAALAACLACDKQDKVVPIFKDMQHRHLSADAETYRCVGHNQPRCAAAGAPQ